jgi:glutaredoxin 3
VAFTAKDIREDPSAINELRAMGAMGTPVVVVDGQPVMGFNPQRITELLRKRTAGTSG